MLIRASSFRAVAAAMAVCVVALFGVGAVRAAGVERVPVNAQGQPIGEKLASPALSYDGRYLVFQSTDDDLVAGDDNGVADVFLYDSQTSELVRASGGFLATFGSGHSLHPAISADGRFVAFASDSNALNLPIELGQTTDVIDNNLSRDIFVYDRDGRKTAVVSVQTGGALLDAGSDYPSISGDGRVVVFQSLASTPAAPGGVWRIFAHDRSTGETKMISVDENGRGAGLDSERPVISADGRYVAFESDAALVRADTNGRRDIYRYDLREGRVAMVSVSSAGGIADGGSRGATITADGSMIAFESGASNLVDGDTNVVPDIFARDLKTGSTSRVSVGSDGEQSNGSSSHASISADGSMVLFESFGQTLAPLPGPRKPEDADRGGGQSSVYVHEMRLGLTSALAEDVVRSTTTRNGDPVISGDGTTMVFAELPLFEVPGGTVGGDLYGVLNRGVICSDVPDFGVLRVDFNGIEQMPAPADPANVTILMTPDDLVGVELKAAAIFNTCAPDTIDITLAETTIGLDTMVFFKNPDSNNLCGSGMGPTMLPGMPGLLASTTMAGDDLSISLCWAPVASNAVLNFGTYNLTFTAKYPDSLLSSVVHVTIQVLPCEGEADLTPGFLPPNGFTSGNMDQSQFDIVNNLGEETPDGIPDFLFERLLPPDNDPDTPNLQDIHLLRMLPSEVAEFRIRLAAFCASGRLVEFSMPQNMFPQDSSACALGGADSPLFPCFVEVLGIDVSWDNAAMMTSGVVTVDSLPNPFTPADFAMVGIPAGADVQQIEFRLRGSPSVLDIGNNLISFRFEDNSGHISDPQLDILVRGCFEGPCCRIDNYLIDGELIPTTTLPDPDDPQGGPKQCGGEDLLFPDFDLEVNVFPNQTMSFDVHGKQPTECLGTTLRIEPFDAGGMFPPGVICVENLPGFVCFGEEGQPYDPVDPAASDIKTRVQWTPGLGDVGSYTLQFQVINSTGQGPATPCVVRVNVCPPPACEIYQDDDGDGVADVDMLSGLRIPLGMGTGSVVVVAGDSLNFVATGMQDCGEFTVDPATDALSPGFRQVWLKPTAQTCTNLALLGCALPLPGCDLPAVGFDDPADGQDPFEAMLAYQCTVPAVFPPGFPMDGVLELCWDVYDASVAVDADGNPLDPQSEKIGQCCVTVTVCPPVTCDVTEVMADGAPVDPMFDPAADTVDVTPGMDNLMFKITGGGGCEGDLVRFDSFNLTCLDDMGAPVDLTGLITGTLADRFVVTDINDNPIAFPYVCDAINMCMIKVTGSLGADLYGICDKIVVDVSVTSDPGGPNEQTTSCGVMARVGVCPEPPLCALSVFSPSICTLDGTPPMYNFPSMGMDGMDLVPTYEIHLEPGSPTIGTAMFMFTADTTCFGGTFDWMVKGYPITGDPVNPATLSVLPSVDNSMQVTSMFAWTPGDNSPSMPSDDLGDHFVTFTVTDNTGVASTCQVRIIVCEAPTCIITEDDPLSCGSTGDIEVSPGDTVTWTFSTTSTCTPATELMVDVTGVPAGATHTNISLPAAFMSPPIGSTFTWTPNVGDVGVHTIIYTTKDRCGREQTCMKTIRVCEKPVCLMTVLVNGAPVVYDPNNPTDVVSIKPGEDLALELCGMSGSPDCNDLPLTISLLSSPMGGPALNCNPALPVMGVLDAQGMLCTDCTILPGPLDVSPSQYVWRFGIEDTCGRVSDDLCELRVLVTPCDPPVCDIQDIMLDDSPYDPATGPPIVPGQTLTYTVKGTLACVHNDIDLILDCTLPTGATVTPGPLTTMDKVTMRTWDVEWTPVAGEFCNVPVSIDCTLRVTPPETVENATSQCNLDVQVGECPAPTCVVGPIMVDSGSGFVVVGSIGSGDGCDAIYAVQPGDKVMFDVTGLTSCPIGAENTLTLEMKQLPARATMVPPLPLAGGLDQSVMSTFMWTVTEEDCGDNPMAIFNVLQTCGPNSLDCKVCFTVGVCDEPPTCDLSDFMIRPNPDMCFNIAPEEDLPFQDLPVEMVPDGYMVNAFPGDTIKLTLCGETVCTCTSLTLDAAGLPEGFLVECLDPMTDLYEPCDFPVVGGQNESPICAMVQFKVPPTESFHVTFTVKDSDPMTADAVCELWVEVETVCNDFEPNDECELPQTISTQVCGPYLSGQLEERVTPGCRPDTYLVLFDKLNVILNADNNSSLLGDGKASALFDITAANGLSPGNGSERWLRIGVTGYPDGLVQPFNGYPQNGPHGQLGEFQMTVTFFDGAGEIISPAIVQDADGDDVVIDNPFVYTNEFITGAEAFRLNFQAPRAFQGGGVTASASVEIDNSTGLDPLCDDVDFFKYVDLVPFTDYCITAVGGLSKDCTPIDLQLGWFDKSCALIGLDCDSGPSGVAQLCVVSDTNGEITIGVTGKGDDDFDGYLTPPVLGPDGRAVNGCPDPTTDHGVCGCYTLCIMTLNPATGALALAEKPEAVDPAMVRSMEHGDMNMDGRTDTADLGILVGRFGWKASDGVTPATGSVDRPNKTGPRPGSGLSDKLSGALED